MNKKINKYPSTSEINSHLQLDEKEECVRKNMV
jgi:hypothetical protein